MRVAFVTYNSVRNIKLGDVVKSGWYHKDDRAVLVLGTNNPMGIEEALLGLVMQSDPRTVRLITAVETEKCQDAVDQVWTQLRTALNTLDHVLLYIGMSAAEKVIELARQIPAEKITFVMCGCDVSWKQRMIAEAGLQNAKTVVIEVCGGEWEMGEFFQAFLETGALPS